MRTTYLITIKTGNNYELEEYEKKAKLLSKLVEDILSDQAKIRMITKYNPIDSVHVDIEVAETMVFDVNRDQNLDFAARVVIDMESSKKAIIDKSVLTKLIRNHPIANNWEQLTIEKRLADQLN